jgi:hypothetical protein
MYTRVVHDLEVQTQKRDRTWSFNLKSPLRTNQKG